MNKFPLDQVISGNCIERPGNSMDLVFDAPHSALSQIEGIYSESGNQN
jgi:hypothetical protein